MLKTTDFCLLTLNFMLTVIDMQIAVNREKDRLMTLKESLDREKQKNSELMNQIGSQNQRSDQFG